MVKYNATGNGGVRTSVSFLKKVQCVSETLILVEQQPPKGVFICDHAGLVINNFSQTPPVSSMRTLRGGGGAPVVMASIHGQTQRDPSVECEVFSVECLEFSA